MTSFLGRDRKTKAQMMRSSEWEQEGETCFVCVGIWK